MISLLPSEQKSADVSFDGLDPASAPERNWIINLSDNGEKTVFIFQDKLDGDGKLPESPVGAGNTKLMECLVDNGLHRITSF